jgi:hypothetical protein
MKEQPMTTPLDPDPLDVTDDWPWNDQPKYVVPTRKPGIPRAVIGWALVSLAVVVLAAAWVLVRGMAG